MPKPTGVKIDGISYRFRDDVAQPYAQIVQPALVRQAEIAGASRPSGNTRPEELPWRWDDWSAGEGQKFFDTSPEKIDISKRMYLSSSGAVDIGTPGQVKLGLAVTESLNVGALLNSSKGPFLVVSNDIPWVFYSTAANSYKAKNFVSAAWSAEHSQAGASNEIIGAPAVNGTWIFVTNAQVVDRLDATDTSQPFSVTQAVATSGAVGVAANSRVYYGQTGSGDLTIKRFNASSSGVETPTTIYTAKGLTGIKDTSSIGSQVYILTQDGTEPRLHVISEDVGSERLRFPVGFRVNSVASNQMETVNDLLFVGGYRIGATGEPDTPALYYVTGDRFGLVATMREGTADRIHTVAATAANELVMGTQAGTIYRYNLETGAVSQFIQGLAASQTPTSIVYVDGVYFIASINGTTSSKVYSTLATGNSKYPTSSTLTGSIWDYNYPEENKTLTKITIETEPLAAGESVGLSLLLYDDSASGQTTITTDSAGTTMTHSGTNKTRTTFTMSSASTERSFLALRPTVTLTAGTNQATTPTLRRITMTARASGVIRFFRCQLDLDADTPGQSVTASHRYSIIEDLIENAVTSSGTTSKIFSLLSDYPTQRGYVPSASTTFAVTLEQGQLEIGPQGKGYADLTLRVIE